MAGKGHALSRHEIIQLLTGLACILVEVPAGAVSHVSSGDVWSVSSLVVEGELRIDGEVHSWGDVTGGGTITGEGELRLH